MFTKRLTFLALIIALALTTAQAGELTFTLDREFSGATPSVGFPTATFSDTGQPAGTVLLTLDLTGLTQPGQKVSDWGFNYSGTATSLSFTPDPGEATSIETGSNIFKADGDGFYDIHFTFPTSGNTFEAGETLVYTISNVVGGVNAFNLFSAPGGGSGVFLSAAHVQGIGAGGAQSGWMGAVPEPGFISLLGVSAAGLLVIVQRRRTKNTIEETSKA